MKPILLALLLCLPTLALAQADLSGAVAAERAKAFYCDTAGVFSGNTGVLIGLAVAAFGFYKLIFSGIGLGSILLIAGGVLFTAIPTWFEAGLDSLNSIFSSAGSSGGSVSGSCN